MRYRGDAYDIKKWLKAKPFISGFAFSRYLFPASDYRESLNAETTLLLCCFQQYTTVQNRLVKLIISFV